MKLHKNLKPGLIIIVCLLSFSFLSMPTNESKPLDFEFGSYPIPQDLNFAGESVPLHQNDVYERMDRELLVNSYWHSNSLLMIKRAHKYLPIIDPILKKHGIPHDFRYLPVIESGLLNVTSPAGAKGFWQFMKSTAREYGLEVNDNVDERYHIEKATEVACVYLKSAKEKFGSWTLAAAAYNAGRARILRYLDIQQVENYYDLLLGEETGRYVFRLLAMKLLLTNPTDFGFEVPVSDRYELRNYKVLEIDTAITNLAKFSEIHGITYKELKLYNPWLLENHLNNKSRKLYEIKIPQ